MSSLFCKECNKTLSGPAPYLDHIKSAKHQKRVASLGKLESFLEDGGQTKAPSTENNPFECKVCRVFMNSLGSLETHNKGKRHLRAVKVQEDLRKLDPAIVPSAPGETQNAKQECASSSIPSPQRRQPCAPTAQAPQVLQTEPSQKAIPPVTDQSENKGLSQEVDLSCDCCGIVLFKDVSYKLEHLETDAHQKRRLSQIIVEEKQQVSKKPRLEAVVETEPASKVNPVVADEKDCSSNDDSCGHGTLNTPGEQEEEEEEEIYDDGDD
ncbi:unnamed protein product, partial [Ixodes hexagonus]